VGGTFVRPAGAAPLLGMNIGSNKNYDDPAYQAQLARLDIAILGFYQGWKGDTNGSVIRRAVQQIKALHPGMKVGQYTILNESKDDPARTSDDDKIVKLDQMNWWLRDAVTGAKTQWTTSYGAWDINQSAWAQPDANGDRWPQWLAKRDHRIYFNPVPEFDIWYFDNVMKYSRIAVANWKYDGTNWSSTDAGVATAYRQGQLAHWQKAAALAPTRVQMGNTDNNLAYNEFRGQLGGAFLEGLMGKSYSLEGSSVGWAGMMKRYFDVAANLKSPAYVGFNVHGNVTDYRFFRYAFTSCLLGDGHFSFTDIAVGYSSVPWFDEYEVSLGAAVEPPTSTAWSNGVVRRRYEKALVLVNPTHEPRTVTLESGWRRLLARQDATVNNGEPVTTITLPAKDGLVLVPR
jgi:hypothetical protein